MWHTPLEAQGRKKQNGNGSGASCHSLTDWKLYTSPLISNQEKNEEDIADNS